MGGHDKHDDKRHDRDHDSEREKDHEKGRDREHDEERARRKAEKREKRRKDEEREQSGEKSEDSALRDWKEGEFAITSHEPEGSENERHEDEEGEASERGDREDREPKSDKKKKEKEPKARYAGHPEFAERLRAHIEAKGGDGYSLAFELTKLYISAGGADAKKLPKLFANLFEMFEFGVYPGVNKD